MQKRRVTFFYRLFGPQNHDVTVGDVVNDYTFWVMVQSSAATASSPDSGSTTDQRLIWINGTLMESAERIHLDPKLSIDEIEDLTRQTVAANNLQDGYIRLILSRGEGTLGLNPFSCPEPGVICIADSIRLYPEEMYRDGMKVIVAERPRIPVECLDPSVKSLNYLNNILAKCEALRQGLYEAIMLNTRGEVAEGTGDNIFVVKDGVISTPAPDAGFLLGIIIQYYIFVFYFISR